MDFEEFLKKIETVAHEENSQEKDPPNEKLNEGIKRHCDISLSILVKLYSEYIKKDTATIQEALEYIPLFAVFGQWIGAQLGVSQEEYNKIVDYYLYKYDLMEK